MQFAREVNNDAANYADDTLFVWVLTEDDNTTPGTNILAGEVFTDDVQIRAGLAVGDADTLSSPSAFRDSPLRQSVGYALLVRRSDMNPMGSFSEFELTELFTAIDDLRASPSLKQPHDGEFDFSGCDGGPFQAFESCSCDDNCVGDAVCATDLSGTDVCTPRCSSDNIACPGDSACVLGEGGGVCLLVPVGELLPDASICNRDSECASARCDPISAIGRTACRTSCDTSCEAGYTCADGSCVAAGVDGTPCDGGDAPDEAAGCAQSQAGYALFLALLLWVPRKRR